MLRIGLVNNMGDGALEATERQFTSLLHEAGGGRAEVVPFFMPNVPRSPEAAAFLHGRYADAALIGQARLDALIVTGNEPRTPHISQEAHWDAFRRLADWAEAASCPTLWSCLAAHAAVLHFHGVERRPLERKCSGVFRLSGHVPSSLSFAPHSRMNTVEEADLVRAGYRILRRAEGAGVDAFDRGRFLFLQGHPEYEAETLKGEYRRDFRRFLRGERAGPPGFPSSYFGAEIEGRLAELEMGLDGMGANDAFDRLEAILAAAEPQAVWRPSAVQLYVDWLAGVSGAAAGLREAV
jgi:homoserine O-succinyltransferase